MQSSELSVSIIGGSLDYSRFDSQLEERLSFGGLGSERPSDQMFCLPLLRDGLGLTRRIRSHLSEAPGQSARPKCKSPTWRRVKVNRGTLAVFSE